ncbi:MAG: response regulator [Polyangiaceae bacterium]
MLSWKTTPAWAIARVLKRQGFTVLEAERADGLRIYEENDEKIDLLVSDVLMPRMTGPELLERLRERDPHIRALFVTGYAAPDIQAQAQDSATVLQKPFTIPELLEGIRTALGPET